MQAVSQLSGFANWTHWFQTEAPMLNKAVLDVAGPEPVGIIMARNAQERQEKIYHRAVAFAAAFLMGPLHAWLVAWGVGRVRGFSPHLLGLSFAEVASSKAMQDGVRRIATEMKHGGDALLRDTLPKLANADFRKTLAKGKADLLLYDLLLNGLVFANMGWVRNALGKHITGKQQFTGEMGVLSEEKLDALYEREKAKREQIGWLPKAITISLPFIVPFGAAVLMRRLYLGAHGNNRFWKFLAKLAPAFDYKLDYRLIGRGLVMMGNAALALVSLMACTGEVVTARSHREQVETLIRNVALNVIFFGGEFIWMGLFSRLFRGPEKMPVFSSVDDALKKAPQALKAKVANRAAAFFWGSFGLNIALLCLILYITNRRTLNRLQQDAETLQAASQPAPVNRRPTAPPVYSYSYRYPQAMPPRPQPTMRPAFNPWMPRQPQAAALYAGPSYNGNQWTPGPSAALTARHA